LALAADAPLLQLIEDEVRCGDAPATPDLDQKIEPGSRV
jgi:hypothetical protein